MKKSIAFLFFLALSTLDILGQELNVLDYQVFLEQVQNHHPMSKASDLIIEKGEAGVLIAKGKFDPRISSQWRNKLFDNQDYYDALDVGMQWSSPLALKLDGGFEQSSGIFLNPEENTPQDGLLYLGMSLPIGQGLLIDNRRAELGKAKAYARQAQDVQRLWMNDLLYEAGLAYWRWFQAFHKQLVYEQAVEAADIRYRAIIASVTLGDLPAIDTVEAGIQLQSRILNFKQAQMEFANSTLELSTYLWDQGLIPIQLDSSVQPPPLLEVKQVDPLPFDLDSMVQAHPRLNALRFENEALDFDKRWKQEQLKPALDIKYQFIQSASDQGLNGPFYDNNYRLGAQFNFPVFVRKQRGELKLSKIQIRENELRQLQTEVKLGAEIQSSMNQWLTSSEQRSIARQMSIDSRTLYQAEQKLFEMGESSLFMVNARELYFINAELKHIERTGLNQAAKLRILYSFGSIPNQ